MIRQPSATLHRPIETKLEENNMTVSSTRKILRPTVCSVPKEKLAVTPVFVRDILMREVNELRLRRVLCRKKRFSVNDLEELRAYKSGGAVLEERLHEINNNCSDVDYYQPAFLLKRGDSIIKKTAMKAYSDDFTPYQWHVRKFHSANSYKMTRRIRPLEIRGISKTSIDGLHPLPERPEEQSPSSFCARLPPTDATARRDSLDDDLMNYGALNTFSPPSPMYRTSSRDSLAGSSDGSPVSSRDQSELSNSNTWSECTGNLTGRTSVYSWGNDDDFDRQASATVKRMFDEIDDHLFENCNSQGTDPITVECKEWATTFHHMRILGKQLLPPVDSGTQVIVMDCIDKPAMIYRPDTAATAVSLDDVKTETFANAFNGLSVSGLKVEASTAPTFSKSPSFEEEPHPYAHLEEEIFAVDGNLEEFFAYDSAEPIEKAKDLRKNERNKQCGYPPVTPNAFATDNIINEAFDRLWEEILQGLRGLLQLYNKRFVKEYHKNTLPAHVQRLDRGLDYSNVRTFSRDSSFRMPPLSSQMGLKTNSSVSNYTNEAASLQELMLIRSLSLRQRDTCTSAVPPRDDDNVPPLSRDQLRPISSTFHSSKVPHHSIGAHYSDFQLYGKMSSKGTKRSGRLQPLQPMDRLKTPGVQENDVIGEIVRGTRLHTAGDHRVPMGNFSGLSPQMWSSKTGALPPIERLDQTDMLTTMSKDRTKSPKSRSVQNSKRASSAAINETRRAPHKEKIAITPDSRPNTTHTFRSETMLNDAKRPSMHANVSLLSTMSNSTSGFSDQNNDTTIGVLHGISMPVGTHSHNSKTVSFDDDVEELDDLVMWGHGPPLLNTQQKRRRANVR